MREPDPLLDPDERRGAQPDEQATKPGEPHMAAQSDRWPMSQVNGSGGEAPPATTVESTRQSYASHQYDRDADEDLVDEHEDESDRGASEDGDNVVAQDLPDDGDRGADDTAVAALPVHDSAPTRIVRRPRAPAWRPPDAWIDNLRANLPILAILLVSIILRVYGSNWDEGTGLHPDERAIGDHIASIGWPSSWAQFWNPSSPLNPNFPAYGSLPFYMTVLFGHFLSWWGHNVGGPLAGLSYFDTYDGIRQTGRLLSGFCDTGAVLFVYLIGRHVFGRAAGLLAALLECFTVLDLEFSHMAGVDTYLTFFATGAVYFCVRIVRYGRPRDYIWAGAWIGFAVSCKISAVPLIVPLVVAHAYRGAQPYAPDDASPEGSAPGSRLPANPLLLLLALVVGVVSVFVTMPYAFITNDWWFNNWFNADWWNGVWAQLQLAQGITDSPYTRKFAGLPAYWYPLQQLIGWTMGPPLGLSAVAGVVWSVWRQIRRRRGGEVVLLVWAAVVFGATAGQYMKYLRYMLPLVPMLDLFAGAVLAAAWHWARRAAARRQGLPWRALVVRIAVVAVVAWTVFYGLAYENIYTTENTRLAASRWLVAHVPAGATFTTESWDETLPWGAPGLAIPQYNSINLDILAGDNTTTTIPMFVNALEKAQYITIFSARTFGSVAHQPGRYPYSIRWYQLLFGDKLNFRLVKEFANHPHLGPITINDYQAVPTANQYTGVHLWYEADQNMSEYDHPPVYIFERTGPISPSRAAALLTDNGKLTPAVAAYDPTHTMLQSPAVEKANRSAPTYDDVFPPDNPLARVPLLSWLVMIELLGLLALPLVMRACRGLRDGGYGLAKLCGIVIVAYLTWLAASLHVAVYSRGLILVSCLIVLLLSLALGLRPRALWAEIRTHRRGIIWAEVVFVVGFLAFAAVRMAYPDLWHMTYGGERTQEISFTNAILRSQYFPPLDPWFAGGTINYYYYGQYLTGMLMKLIGISVPMGFNLALPTLYALVLSLAFSIGYNATGRVWVGWAALSLEGALGNLGPLAQFAQLAPNPSGAALIPGISGLRNAIAGIFAVLSGQVSLPPDFFWTASRILSTSNGDAINEFPIWSFTYGDMHAHVIDEPIVLAVVGLALAVSGLGDSEKGRPLGVARLLLLGALMAVVAGATGPTNLWDLPTSVVILVAGFGLRGWFAGGRRGWPLVVRDVALPGIVIGGLCLVLYRPFYSTVLGISSGFTFLSPHTPTDQYLMHLGLMLFLLASFTVVFLLRETRPFYWWRRLDTLTAFAAYYADQANRLPRLYRVARAMRRRDRPHDAAPHLLTLHLLLTGVLLTGAMLLVGFETLALIAALLTLTTMALCEACARWQLPVQEGQPFALALATMGLSLTAIPDFVMQNEAGRMNTFFKLYNQAWPLLAISAALFLSALVRSRRSVAVTSESVPMAVTRVGAPAPALSGYGEGAVSLVAVPAPMEEEALVGSAATAQTTGAVETAWMAEHSVPESVAAVGEDSWADNGAAPAGSPVESPAPELTVTDANGDGVGRPIVAPAQVSRRRRGITVPAGLWEGYWEWRALWWVALGILVFGAALYPIFGTYSHLQLRSQWNQTADAAIPTGLDGAAFVRVLYPYDWAAIQWINANIKGTPVLLTSERGNYRDFATKVTMFTGLPNVISWDFEENQERYAGQGRPQSMFPSQWVNQLVSGVVTWNGTRWVTNVPTATSPAPTGTRNSAVETIYNTTDVVQALTLLHEYHVSYVYVGTAERGDPNSEEPQRADLGNRAGFDPAGLAKFNQMVTAGQLRVAYHNPGAVLYQVMR